MENFDVHEVAEKIMAAIQKEYKELKTLNVMILGKTGVGKSTLINNMFNEKMAETGIGKPVTHTIRKITKPDFPLAIYDTPGLELGGKMQLILCWMKCQAKSTRASEAEMSVRQYTVFGTVSVRLHTDLSKRK